MHTIGLLSSTLCRFSRRCRHFADIYIAYYCFLIIVTVQMNTCKYYILCHVVLVILDTVYITLLVTVIILLCE